MQFVILRRQWTILFLILMIQSESRSFECPNNCSCTNSERFSEFFCPESDPEVFISIDSRRVGLECFNPKPNHTQTEYCSINTVLNEMLSISDIENVKEFSYESIPQNFTHNITVTKNFFRSLRKLNTLKIIYDNTVYFAPDFLKNTPHISVLVLNKVGLYEIDGYFKYVPKLLALGLSKNRISFLAKKPFTNLSSLTKLYLNFNNLTILCKDAFNGLRSLQKLDLSNNCIQELRKDIFVDLGSLLHIKLEHNCIVKLSSNIFKNNSLIRIIELFNNTNLVLPDYLFRNLTALDSLALNNNNLTGIPETIFKQCVKLKDLSLEENQLSSLPEMIFGDLLELRFLNVSTNILLSLPQNLFSATIKLEMIDLSNNQLSIIHKSLFKNLDRLYQVDFHGNRILLIEANAFNSLMLSLTHLDLSYNKWNASSGNNSLNYCQRLKELYLGHNEIRQYPYMPALINLQKFDLSFNQIEYFEIQYAVRTLYTPTEINLSNNLIEQVSFVLPKPLGEKEFNDDNTRIVINLTSNPISCTNCSNYDLARYNSGEMKELMKIVDISQDNLFCLSNNNISFKNLKSTDVGCPVLNGCPLECDCTFTPYNEAISVDCSFNSLTIYPEFNFETTTHRQVILNLTGNDFTKGPVHKDSYHKVTYLDLSNNRIAEINWIPPYIKELNLKNNSLKNLNGHLIKTLKKYTSLEWLYLKNNPWECECQASDFRDYLIENYNKVNLTDVYCENDQDLLVKMNDLCKESSYVFVLLPTVLTIFLCASIILVLYYRYQFEIKMYLFDKNMCLRFVTEEELDKHKMFDVFLSYSNQDEDFVVDQLLPELECGANAYKVCIHIRDWIPGEFIAQQIIDSVQNSRRTLVVLSDNFLTSVWGKMEFRVAYTEAISEGRARLIVLIYEDVSEDKLDDELKNYLKTNTYIKWGDKYFWNKLRYALPHVKCNGVRHKIMGK